MDGGGTSLQLRPHIEKYIKCDGDENKQINKHVFVQNNAKSIVVNYALI